MSPAEMLKRLIKNHYRRLQKLKEREALYGLNVDLNISLEIEDIEEKIVELEQELAEISSQQNSSSQPAPIVSETGQERGPAVPDSMMTMSRLALPDQNPALRDLRRWLVRR